MDIAVMVRHLGAWTAAKGPLHRLLAAALMTMIRDGIVLPGTRLPAERPLADALAISRTTVVTAYNTLRADGWLESRTGGGTWVGQAHVRIARDRAQSTVISHGSLLDLLTIDDETVDLATGSTMPLTSMVLDVLARSRAVESTITSARQYWPLGLPALRQALAEMYTRQGVVTDVDQILVTCGAQQGISLITTLLVQRGDLVLMETPTFFGALDAFRFAGARVAGVAVGPRHVEPANLRDRIFATGPRLVYLTPTYHNPTGLVMPEKARQAIAQTIEETGVTLVEDHALSDLILDGSVPRVIAGYARTTPILTLGSISKVCWAGLRVGWVRGPAATIRQLGRLKSAADLGGPLPTQAMAVPLIARLEEAKALRRDELRPRRELLVQLLRAELPEWTFTVPSGGLFLWVHAAGVNMRQFAQYAARHRVALAPGAMFSVDEAHEDYLRVPFMLDEAALRDGVARLVTAWRGFHTLAPHRESRPALIV